MSPAAAVFPLFFNACFAAAVFGIAVSLRPWRALGHSGPPWPWVAAWAALPLLWGLDRWAGIPILTSMSGASMLVLLAGWPLAVLAMVPAAVVTALAGHVNAIEALHRLVWLGDVPATAALALGAALRRWMPHHLFIYILGRGFFGTFVAVTASAAAALLFHELPEGAAQRDMMIAHVLGGFGEAFLTGAITAILVAFRPQWLATYADRLYLPPANCP